MPDLLPSRSSSTSAASFFSVSPRPLLTAGVDEAGRGCLAGPVAAGAVILPAGFHAEGLTDSKKVSEPSRRPLELVIKREALAWAVGVVWPEEIDRIMQAWFTAQLAAEGLSHDRLAAQARVAMLLSDLPTRWPYAFLDQEHTSGEARVAMEKSALQAGPDLAVSNMVPREIDLGVLPEAAGDTLDTLERWPLIRLLLLWALFAAVMAALFALTRR